MKRLYFIFLSIQFIFFLSKISNAEVYTNGSAVDNNGNLTVVGYCFGRLSVCGINVEVPVSSGFVVRLNSEGEMLWYKIIQSSVSSNIYSVGVDDEGNSYITGGINGITVFDTLTISTTVSNAFIAKYDSLGNILWVKQGITSSASVGKDIWIDESGNSYTIGDGGNISFDSLQIISSVFVVKHDAEGNAKWLIKPTGITLTSSIAADYERNIIYSGTYPWGPNQSPFPLLAKMDSSGNTLWSVEYTALKLSSDNNANIFTVSGTSDIFLRKFNLEGNLLYSTSFGGLGVDGGKDISLSPDGNIYIVAEHSGGFQFGTDSLTSFGLKDALIAKLDSNFNVIWVKSGGGITNDQLKNVSIASENSVYVTGNFKGEITFGNIQISGGTSEVSNWVTAIKFNQLGDIIWLKKVIETKPILTQGNWFPLEVGNHWQYFNTYRSGTWGSKFRDIYVIDSIYIENKKYFRLSGYMLDNYSYYFPPLTLRYDDNKEQIKINLNNKEYTFFDFSLSNGELFEQIQPDGSYLNGSAVTTTLNIFNQSIVAKGLSFTIWPRDYLLLFAEGIGCLVAKEVKRYDPTNPPSSDQFDLMECLLIGQAGVIHFKHFFEPDIQFDSVFYLPDTVNNITQNFLVDHYYSRISQGPSIIGVSYIDSAKLESYYYNSTDTIFNSPHRIIPITEKDFSLNFPIDTNLYNQGYHLFYRIMAKDKGIMPSYYYKPEEGYYKLYWRDSVSSVIQMENISFYYSLSQNYPNPFNPKTKIEFALKEKTKAVLRVYDILGNEVCTLVNEELPAGKYQTEFSGEGLSSGIYIYRIVTSNYTKTQKMMLLK